MDHNGWRLLDDGYIPDDCHCKRAEIPFLDHPISEKPIDHLWIVAGPSGSGKSDVIHNLLHQGRIKGLGEYIGRTEGIDQVSIALMRDFKKVPISPVLEREVFMHVDLHAFSKDAEVLSLAISMHVQASARVTLFLLDPPFEALPRTYEARKSMLLSGLGEIIGEAFTAPEHKRMLDCARPAARLLRQLGAVLDREWELSDRREGIGSLTDAYSRICGLAPGAKEWVITHNCATPFETYFGRQVGGWPAHSLPQTLAAISIAG
jgi:hypothetical protein